MPEQQRKRGRPSTKAKKEPTQESENVNTSSEDDHDLVCYVIVAVFG